ncbi:RNA dependent RNA polymerase-domain-containing protein [Lyophyllum atratum]|nr:RNA dependent RNA polymerase-domain-containing protein [Lyophyllum atratum]
MRQERNRSPPRDVTPASDYDGYFPELNDDDIDAWDAIESLHNSPTKEFSSLSTGQGSFSSLQSNKSTSGHLVSRLGGGNAASYSSASHRTSPYPSTPSRKHTPDTPRSRRLSAIKRGFDSLSFTSPNSEKAFPTGIGHYIDSEEVSSLLTDTDNSSSDGWAGLTPNSDQGSLGDLGSSGWSLPLGNSFKISTPAGKKRLGDSQTSSASSPSKYRKLADREARPIHRDTSTRPQVVDDIFGGPSSSASSAPAPRNNGWNPQAPFGGSALEDFLSGPLGVDLTPSIIAHNAEVQSLLDKADIAWGVQYEIARGISREYWTWADVKPKVEKLRGLNQDVAYKVSSIMLDQPQKLSDLAIWKEFDREQAAIIENQGRGLGLRGTWYDEPDWYGGKIQQLARLAPHNGSYKVHLDLVEKRRSYRLARFLGSRRILQLRIPDDMAKKESPAIKEFLLQKFILCGRVFVPFFAKEGGVYLVETDEDFERRPKVSFGDNHRMSLKAIVNWHNALELNVNQPISKWVTRFALAFSDSIPALEFAEDCIHAIDDIYAPWDGPGKAPAEKIHTDGCGLINEAALKIIARALGLSHRPSAVQGRIKGSKGLWIFHPTDTSEEPRIWIRPSQSKIVYRYPLDRAHCIFDLLSVSRFSPPIKLSKQSIMNLSENGVSDEVLTGMMVQGLMDEVTPLMKWQGPQAMESLWQVVNQLGGVSRSRLSRLTAGLSRVMGLQRREWGHEDIGMETEDDSLNALTDEQDAGPYTGRNEFSGAPLSIHELALELIQAGFRPDKLANLNDKIRQIVQNTIKSIIEKFSIPLPESLGAFVVPDPLGILEEGEVYFRSSQSLTDPQTQTLFNVVTGDVLLGRYPVRLPSDVQKVKAVDRPEFFNYPDVLIVSTKGDCSMASLLAGGDCDGDDLFIIREKSIVDPFQSKPLSSMPPNLLQEYFEGHPERVKQFADRVASMSPHEAQKSFQEILLLNLSDSKVGLYSNFQDFAVWKYGYTNKESIRLAYMFNILLDSSKTGLRLKSGVFEKDQKRFGSSVPEKQENHSRRFIFHTLAAAGEAAGEELLRDYDATRKEEVKDADLSRPYTSAAARALKFFDDNALTPEHRRLLTNELELIRAPVKEARILYGRAMRRFREAKEKAEWETPRKKSKKTRQREPDPFLQASQVFDREVQDVMLLQNVRELKASYAYELDPAFAFAVAFRDLCDLKARATPGGHAPTIRSFDQAKTIPATYVKALARLVADGL